MALATTTTKICYRTQEMCQHFPSSVA